MKTYTVYIITNQADRVLYTGVTSDLMKRLYQHTNKMLDGFSSRYKLDKLVYLEQTENVESAILREKQIKGWTRQKKIDLINAANPSWDDLAEELSI